PASPATMTAMNTGGDGVSNAGGAGDPGRPRVESTWVGDAAVDHVAAPASQAGPRKRLWAGAALAAVLLLIAGIGIGLLLPGRTSTAPDSPEIGAVSGFDSRTPGFDADGEEVPFLNLRYHPLEQEPSSAGFQQRCSDQTLLYAIGPFTPCAWAVAVYDELAGYDEDTYLGYEPSLLVDGVETYCHYHNSGIEFTEMDDDPDVTVVHGVPAWECRADGGRQFVMLGLTGALVPPRPCWDA